MQWVLLTAPEAAIKAINDLGAEQEEIIEQIDMELNASGSF